MIYTMNVKEARMRSQGYPEHLATTEFYFGYTFHEQPELIYAFDTYEFTDYNKFRASHWNEPEKGEHRRTQFPIDCQNAFEAGRRMVTKIRSRGQAGTSTAVGA